MNQKVNLRIKKKVKISWGWHVASTESHKVDRLTNLPDCITSNILSRLVAEEATRTSVLSRDWKHKWTFIYDVDITIRYNNFYEAGSFYSFVDRVLDSNPDLNLRTFRLNLFSGLHDPHHLERWISKALGRSVKELRVDGSNAGGIIVLERPTSLTRLYLFTECTFVIRIENCFLNLKSLYLHGCHSRMKIFNEQSPNTGELSLNFPVLEQLELEFIVFMDVKFVTINAPKLTSFTATSRYNTKYVIKIFAPRLREFKSYGDELDSIVLHAPSLYSAALLGYVDWKKDIIASRASPLLQGVPGLKCLELSCEYMKALAEWKGVHGYPTFDRLIRLTVDGHKANGLMELLQATPNLKSLTVDVRDFVPNPLQEPLPLCIVSQLKRVCLLNYSGERFQNDVANYFLKNAKKLKRVYLHPYWKGLKKAAVNSWISGLRPKDSSRINVMHNQSP